MKSPLLARFLAAGALAFAGFCGGFLVAGARSGTNLERLIAVSWGDGRYGPAFYGAHVYLVPENAGYSVRARVLLGRGNGYVHECGELGKAANDVEAVRRWGTIAWRADGLHIGSGATEYFLPRARLESHR